MEKNDSIPNVKYISNNFKTLKKECLTIWNKLNDLEAIITFESKISNKISDLNTKLRKVLNIKTEELCNYRENFQHDKKYIFDIRCVEWLSNKTNQYEPIQLLSMILRKSITLYMKMIKEEVFIY